MFANALPVPNSDIKSLLISMVHCWEHRPAAFKYNKKKDSNLSHSHGSHTFAFSAVAIPPGEYSKRRWRSNHFNHLKSVHKLHFSLNVVVIRCAMLCCIAFCMSWLFTEAFSLSMDNSKSVIYFSGNEEEKPGNPNNAQKTSKLIYQIQYTTSIVGIIFERDFSVVARPNVVAIFTT